MFNRPLFIRYSLLFILISLIGTVILAKIKTSVIADKLAQRVVNTKQHYFTELRHKEQLVELIFYNHFNKNSDILAIYENNTLSSFEKQQSLFKLLKNTFFYLKSMGIQSVRFYDKQGALLLQSDIPLVYNLTVKKGASHILESIQKGKNNQGFFIDDSSVSMKYIKPFINEKFERLGAIEISLNMGHFSHEINQESKSKSTFVFSQKLLETTLSSIYYSQYESYSLNAQFIYKNTLYENIEKNEEIYKTILKKHYAIIKKQMQKEITFSLAFEYMKSDYALVFVPLFSKSENKFMGYFTSYKKSETITQLKEFYWYLLIGMFTIFALLCASFYFIHEIFKKKSFFQNKYDQFKKDIDKFVIMIETDTQGIITYVSSAFCSVSKYQPSDLIGHSLNIIRHPDMSKQFFENMWEKISSGEVWEGEIKNRDKNNNAYWIKGNIVPIVSEEGEITGYRSIRINITDAKQLQKVNALLKEDLAQKLNEISLLDRNSMDISQLEVMGKLLDSFSSEWKKYLSTISLKLIDLETRLNKNVYTKAYLEELSKHIAQQVQLLSTGLNEFKLLYYGEDHHRYDVLKAIEYVLDSYEVPKDISVTLHAKEKIFTYGVAYDLQQIIKYLLKNSITAFQKSNKSLQKIDISLIKNSGDVLIKFEDNATGISKELRDNLFEPNSTTDDNTILKGTGLYISKLLAQKCHGKIWLEKSSSEGTSFCLRLTLKDRRVMRRLT